MSNELNINNGLTVNGKIISSPATSSNELITLGQLLSSGTASAALRVINTEVTLADAATVSWNFANGNIGKVILAGNRNLSITNVPTSSFGILFVTQDTTGSRTLALTGSKASGSNLTSGSNSIDMLGFYFNGSTYYWTFSNNFI